MVSDDGDVQQGARHLATVPSATFIGRGAQLEQAQAALCETRILTVTGPGGVGKTRFARELLLLAERASSIEIGCVDLAATGVPDQVPAQTAVCLGVADLSNRPAYDQLVRYLAARRCLVLFDNCEHVREAAGDLARELVAHCPGLTVVATSTEPLDVEGERIMVLPSLSLPSAQVSVEESEAVALLVERARRVNPDFVVDDGNRSAVVDLCRRLDGLPLAIEIAAARMRVLSPGQLVERLDARFDVLVSRRRDCLPRHRTLRAMVDWSFERCTPAEQRMWMCLSVFSGQFDLAGAEAVCAAGAIPSGEVVDVLDGLVAKSVLSVTYDAGAARFRQLNTIREYGRGLLEEFGLEDRLARRYRDHFLGRARQMVDAWFGPEQADHLRAIRASYPEFEASLEWSVTTPGESDTAARLASDLRYFWVAGGRLSDGRRWLDRILRLATLGEDERASTTWVRTWVALLQGDIETARQDIDWLRSRIGETGDGRLAARTDYCEGLLGLFTGNLEGCVRVYRSAIDRFRRAGDAALACTAEFQLAVAQSYAGDYAGATAGCEDVMRECERHGERWNRAYALWVSGLCAWHRGDRAGAHEFARRSLEQQRTFEDGICIALDVHLLSWIAGGDLRPDLSAELAGYAHAVWSLLGTAVTAFGPHISGEAARHSDMAATTLGARRLDALLNRSRGSSKLAAIDRGLALSAGGRGPTVHFELLTPRESEVADAISRGLSNRQIAQRLVISARTVEGHVERILQKLGCTSRTQVAAWVLTSTTRQDPA